jgi:general secretion pathway protein G
MKKGFSLIEVMIVIVILGLIASLVVPNLIGQSEKAKEKLVCIQMKSLKDSLNSYKLEKGRYPSTEEGLNQLIKDKFLDSKHLPLDPWGGEYIYLNNGGEIEIISLGADKKEGGSGENRDIKLSQCQK